MKRLHHLTIGSVIAFGTLALFVFTLRDGDSRITGQVNSGGGNQCTFVCGNGTREGSEECDDGNQINGDGCTRLCTSEGNGSSSSGGSSSNGSQGSSSSSNAVCGNGRKEGQEQCDDGNTANGDGCSSQCRHEQCAYELPVPPGCTVTPIGQSTITQQCTHSPLPLTSESTFSCATLDTTVSLNSPTRLRGVYQWLPETDNGFGVRGTQCGIATIEVLVDGVWQRSFQDLLTEPNLELSRPMFDLDLTAGSHRIQMFGVGSLRTCAPGMTLATPDQWKGFALYQAVQCPTIP